MKYLFFCILTCYLGFSQNQDATLFLHNGDTRNGFAMINPNDEIVFKTRLEGRSVTLDFTEVKRIEFYGFEDSVIFEYFNISNKPTLLELLTEGGVLLLCNTHEEWVRNGLSFGAGVHKTTTSAFFLKRTESNEILSLNSPFFRWKKKMTEYFSDCDELVRKIRTNEFNRSDLKEIVEYYNDFCTEL